MSIREATRSLTSWLMLDLPITNALRRALAQLDVDVGDVLLMGWEKVSATTFTGTVALGDGAIVDLVYEVGEEAPRISWWQERDGADPRHVEFTAVAAELRGYAGESRNEREARLAVCSAFGPTIVEGPPGCGKTSVVAAAVVAAARHDRIESDQTPAFRWSD